MTKKVHSYTVVIAEDADAEYDRDVIADMAYIIQEVLDNPAGKRNLEGTRGNVTVVCNNILEVSDDKLDDTVDKLANALVLEDQTDQTDQLL
jgi:hypothetical protein